MVYAIIYSNTLTNIQALDETKYDIEHIVTKKLMKDHLAKFEKNNIEIHLPLSSIGNICLLPEFVNRRKQKDTIYQDKAYLTAIKKKDLTLEEVESKYSFTDKRFEKISEKVIDSLYGNDYS